MREWADFTLEQDDEKAVILALRGPLRVSSIGDLDARIAAAAAAISKIDISRVSEIDTSGAWLVSSLAEEHGVPIIGASDQATRLIRAVSRVRESEAEIPPSPGLIIRSLADLGRITVDFLRGSLEAISFIGALLIALGGTIRHPGRLRVKALVHQMQLVGVNSLFIIGLMSFLVGIVIAQQGALQLREFGAEIYTINLTGRLAFRELGILMTAIMVAGRSGSSFAAQIGTMKLTEEVDAMRTIGVSPMEALVIPRVLATMFMMVLLGFYASLIAIIGGAFISTIQLGIPFLNFLERIQEVVPTYDLWVGLTKAPVFGFIIAIAGCFHGMQVKSNSEEVGLRTTQAVVTAIFAVIVLDAFFAVFFSEVGWG
ncbi:MAG: ABC transporter permease [Novosphingobium sp.]|nr:ABC transporter permease [Novosphingobium sp.]